MHIPSSENTHLALHPEGYIAGVCEGLGRRFGINPNILRIIWLVAIIGFGTGLLLYALLWWLMPRADQMPVEATVWIRESNGDRHPPLARTGVDRKIFGVCGGIARRWDLDPTVVRLAALSILTVSFGLAALAYLVLAVVLPGPETTPRERPHPVEI